MATDDSQGCSLLLVKMIVSKRIVPVATVVSGVDFLTFPCLWGIRNKRGIAGR